MKPEYDQWAEQLLQEIYYAPDEGHRVAIIKEHLLKAVRRGYTDGAENNWIAVQEAAPQLPLRTKCFVNPKDYWDVKRDPKK